MIALVVVGNGRIDYLAEAVASAVQFLPAPSWLLMVDDSGDLEVRKHLDATYPEFLIQHHDQNRGMAAAVQTGFDLALSTSCRYVFWLEEDMVLTQPPPIGDAVWALDQHQWLAQMCFRREPVSYNPVEAHFGDQLAAICDLAQWSRQDGDWTSHDFLFSLNPCLIPRRIMSLGWDKDNERGMTDLLACSGFTFGSWGHPGDGQSWARHIGHTRGAAWQL
jgi:glycosyltransferase involved in cell wall biosynthesis